ncbi:MAG: glycosyltransferase family 4 protein [Chloroflexota bacterium]
MTRAASLDWPDPNTRDRRLHVLEVVAIARVGGMERYVRNLIAGLPEHRFRASCLAPYESMYTDELRALGCPVWITAMRDDPYWHAIQWATGLIRAQQVGVVHAHLPSAHALAALAGRLAGIPIVATVHGMEVAALDLAIAQTAGTHLVTVCQRAYGHALALGVPAGQVSHIPNGVDTDVFTQNGSRAELRTSLGVPAEVPLVGWVGRLRPEKAPQAFLRVAEAVRRSRPDARFVLVGDGPLAAALEHEIQERGLAGCVQLAGVRADMARVYPAFDLLVQTSESEGMPLVILEAMACGRPVVAMDVGGVPEVVQVDTTGLLAAPGDVAWLVKCVLELLASPERALAMGTAGRRRVERHFDLRLSIGRTAALFERLARAQTQANSPLAASALPTNRAWRAS